MANKFQVKRTSVSTRTPNTTNSGNTQYIDAGELALNMSDKILYSSDGTDYIIVGANVINQTVTGNVNFITNGTRLTFTPLAGGANVYFTQQNDDNFVFYTTNTINQSRAVWSVFANSITSNMQFHVPIVYNSNIFLGSVALSANGSTGSAGQVLSSNGTATYWTTPGAASVDQAAQYTWTNTQTFSNTITFSSILNVGANVSVNTSTIFVGNSSTNSTHNSSIVQVSTATSTANLTAADLKIGGTTVVNSTQVVATLHVGNVSGSYANITGQVNTATLYAATSANIASVVQANSSGVYSTNVTITAAIVANGAFGTNNQVMKSNGSIVYWSNNSFNTLSDVPSSYSGNAGSFVVVNPGETGLTFSSNIILSGIGFTSQAAPATPAADNMELYMTSSGTSPNREVAVKFKNELGQEIILSSILV